jgi:hypothetical protein
MKKYDVTGVGLNPGTAEYIRKTVSREGGATQRGLWAGLGRAATCTQ